MIRYLHLNLSSSVRRRLSHDNCNIMGVGVRATRSHGRTSCSSYAATPTRLQISSHQHQQYRYYSAGSRRQYTQQANAVEIARFGLLSAFSLPFVLWISAFTYDYTYRVKICQDALERVDEDLLEDKRDKGSEFLGRDKELAEVMKREKVGS